MKDLIYNDVLLQVSEDGRIFRNGREYKLQRCRLGYLATSISNGKTRARLLAHRAVAIAYLSNPNNLRCVNHKDGNKENNSIENVEWCSHKDNIAHAYDNKLIKKNKRMMDEDRLKIILALRRNGKLQREIAETIGCTQGLISFILRKNAA